MEGAVLFIDWRGTNLVVDPYQGMGNLGTPFFCWFIGANCNRFDRRFRVYDVSNYGETISTYKRTERGEIIDRMVLVGDGAPEPYA